MAKAECSRFLRVAMGELDPLTLDVVMHEEFACVLDQGEGGSVLIMGD